ncbi:calcitonin gene-related peptide type 1 receptor-like [Dermatophagoides pteronyssinus]|uniref:calcitonin gene-related peptide type 1 receptor-like n=1 Tax=Dermatophagoides pteronyssinus TaxID=6956 RepID=UPI003F66F74C
MISVFILILLLSFTSSILSSTTSSSSSSSSSLSMMDRFPCQSNLFYDFRNIDRFMDNMCAQCLWYMAGSESPWIDFDSVNKWQVIYNYSDQINVLLCNPNCTEFTYEILKRPNNSIQKELKSEFYMGLLLDCCEQARQCCERMLKNGDHNLHEKNDHCPAKWDGFMCWNSAKPNTINYQTCPSMTYFALGIKPTSCRNELANKECWSNGTWARINKIHFDEIQKKWINYSEEYTNYLPCSTPGATLKLKFIRTSIVIYIVSLVLTSIGFILLWSFSKERPKLREIHLNFFLSLILTSSFSLCVLIFIKEQHYRLNSMIDKNPIWCRTLMLFMKMARLTNYCWMLNEGIILWQIVVHPLPINEIGMIKFYLLGWLSPFIIISFYTFIHSMKKFNTSCWTKSMGYWELIYIIPTITFIVINTILLIYMMYVLLKKLTTTNNTKQLRSSVCKSLLLVPVFGIHYIFYIVPFDPFESCATYQFIFHYVMIITEALQGSIVTAVFCLFNQEIHTSIKRKFRLKRRRQNNHFIIQRRNTTTVNTDDDDDDATEMAKLNQIVKPNDS